MPCPHGKKYICINKWVFEMSERNEDTELISGVDLIKSFIVVKAFK